MKCWGKAHSRLCMSLYSGEAIGSVIVYLQSLITHDNFVQNKNYYWLPGNVNRQIVMPIALPFYFIKACFLLLLLLFL